MIANHIEYRDGYWYLNAMLHCDMQDYRRSGGGGEEDWQVQDRRGDWDQEDCMSGYCEDLLQAYIQNGGKVKQVFVRE